MAKRSFVQRDSEWLDDNKWVDDVVEQEKEIMGVEFSPASKTTLRLVLMQEKIYKYIGKSTGKQYIWNDAGATQDVDKEDADFLMAKEGYRSCCDSYSNPQFMIVS